MAVFDHIQGILPRCVPVATSEITNQYSDITPAALLRLHWFVQTWNLSITAAWNITGSDGFHNTASASLSTIINGAGGFQVIPPATEHDLLLLLQSGFGIGLGGPGNSQLYTFEDAASSTTSNAFQLKIAQDYAFNPATYNPARTSNFSDLELRVRSYVQIGLDSVTGVGNGTGDTASGNSAFAAPGDINTLQRPITWTNGDPILPFSGGVTDTATDSFSLGGVTYTRNLDFAVSLTPASWWPWNDGTADLYNTLTGALL